MGWIDLGCGLVSIHAAMNHDYAPLTTNFERVIERSRRRAASKER
jgi:hypothetical protein